MKICDCDKPGDAAREHWHGDGPRECDCCDDMRLPAGKRCGDCVHIRRCKVMFGHADDDVFCDWSPSRFKDRGEGPR